jgi:hypothetical protein
MRFGWVVSFHGAGGVYTLPDDFVDLFEERLGAALGFIRAAGLVVQVPLAWDVRVLQTVGPAAELARTGLGQRYEI